MKKVIILLFVFLVGFVYVSAQTSCEKQLFKIGYVFGTKGYKCVFERYNYLSENYNRSHQVYMVQGMHYYICAVCDGSCGDVDVVLYDGYGDVIAEDDSVDSTPVVECSVISSGMFKVKVKMCDCDASSCNYGIAVFGR